MTNKIKIYKSHERNMPIPHTPYVPQYQINGIDPKLHKSALIPENVKKENKPPEVNPRKPKPSLQQPYAEPSPSPVGRGKAPLPNVGNNVEHLWSTSGMDGDIVDDVGNVVIDSNQPLIDNNDEVTPQAYLLPDSGSEWYEAQDNELASDTLPVVNDDASEVDLVSIVRDLEEGAYLLLVSGVPICSAPHQEIEEQAKAMFFGEHEICKGKPIPDDDIVIIKRVPIKIGLFID